SSGDRVGFERCDLTNADLYAAQFPGSCFFDSDLTGAELSQASLAKARMHGSTLEALRGAVSLRGTTISSVQLVPVALQVLAVLEINVDDERDPGTG
ncbi:MAG TPA: pentapeptide repeat-containing protein, partial [Acidimicrobiales bacterium]|nr:pentapeptide repeat-containing protein [Acidimicrobiales bacterium]